MDKRIDSIVENSETIDKATGLYVFSWIRESSARDYIQRYSCNPKRNPETGLYTWPYEPSEANAELVSNLKNHSFGTSSIIERKSLADAFERSLLAELSHSGCVHLYFRIMLLCFGN